MNVAYNFIDVVFVNQKFTVARFYKICTYFLGKLIYFYAFYLRPWDHKFARLCLWKF